MSWQDELAQLDSALASGQISADEYRTRRDRVIAQASGQSAPEQPQQQSAEPTQVFRPVQPPQQPQQQGYEGDRTQIVSGQQGQPGSENTQVVGRSDADSTQIVPNLQQHPQFPPPPPPPPWESAHPQQPMTPPPWANEDLPPEFGQQSWPRQGPEVFEEKSGGGAGKTVGIIVAVVLVLALAGGAIWFFGFKDKGGNQAGGETGGQETTQAPTTTTSKRPDIPKGPFIDLPGEKVLNRTVPIQQAIAEKSPTQAEAELLQSVGVSEVAGLVTEEDGLRRGIWAFKVGEGADPAAVLQAMDGLYNQAKYELIDEGDGVLVRKLAAATPEKDTVYRAHYVTDGYLVRVEVYGKDSANVESTFTDLIKEMTDEFAPAT